MSDLLSHHLNQIELSRRWRISPRTLERWRWLGEGPQYLKIGGRVVYRLSDIESYEAALIRGAGHEPQRPAAAFDSLRLLRPVDLGPDARPDPPHALCELPGAGRARTFSHCIRHRQPDRQKRGKRGRSIDPHGYDAGKKIKGKKRHILVDTQGLLMHALVHAADIQDRDGRCGGDGDVVRALSFPAQALRRWRS